MSLKLFEELTERLEREYETAEEADMPDRLQKYDDWLAVQWAADRRGICSICANTGKTANEIPCVCHGQGAVGEIHALRDQLQKSQENEATVAKILEVMERDLRDKIDLRNAEIKKLKFIVSGLAELFEADNFSELDAADFKDKASEILELVLQAKETS